MEIKGKVLSIGDTVQVTDKFKKRDLIVEYAENPSYPEILKFEAHQDKCSQLDNLSIGDMVEIFFNLKGKTYTKDNKTSYFMTLSIWRINVLGQETSSDNYDENRDYSKTNPHYNEPSIFDNKKDDDLPF